MKVNCPHCYRKYSITDAQFGVQIDCQDCSKPMTFSQSDVIDIENGEFLAVKCPNCEERRNLKESEVGVVIDCGACAEPMKFGKKIEPTPKDKKPVENKEKGASQPAKPSPRKKASLSAEKKKVEKSSSDKSADKDTSKKASAENASKKVEVKSESERSDKKEKKSAKKVEGEKASNKEDEKPAIKFKTKEDAVKSAPKISPKKPDSLEENAEEDKKPAIRFKTKEDVVKSAPKISPKKPNNSSEENAEEDKKPAIKFKTKEDAVNSAPKISRKKSDKDEGKSKDSAKAKSPLRLKDKKDSTNNAAESGDTDDTVSTNDKSKQSSKSRISKVRCPECDQKYSIKKSQFGEKIKCQSCNELVVFDPPKDDNKDEDTPKLVTASDDTSLFASKLSARKVSYGSGGSATLVAALLLLLLLGSGGYIAYVKFLKKDTVANTSKRPIEDKPTPEIQDKPKPVEVKKPDIAITPPKEKPKPINPNVEKKPKPPQKLDFVVKSPPITEAYLVSLKPTNILTTAEVQSGFKNEVQPFFKEHCTKCHGPKKERGDLRIDRIKLSVTDDYTLSHLQNIIDEMAVDNMPPEEEDRPDPAQVEKVIDVLTSLVELTKNKTGTAATGKPVRRLNRTEFINSVKDLLQAEVDKDGLPDDLIVGHFENDSAILDITDSHIEAYADKSREIVKQFIENRNNPGSIAHEFFSHIKDGYETPKDNEASKIIERFAIYARRGKPVGESFVNRLNTVFKNGRKAGIPFWDAISEPLSYSLCSIEAFFHFENKTASLRNKYITGLELANRLSFALWRSAPDIELIKLGRSGKLLDIEVRKQQIDRMMQDQKFDRFLTDFIDQWLELPRQLEVAPDSRAFPSFNPVIKPAMKAETNEFMAHLIRKNLSITNMIDSDFMMLNDQMAKFYGIKGVKGQQFRPVKRTDTPAAKRRGGILTHAGILLQGSTGERNSIVDRGAFITRKILDRPPADPPPDVTALPVNEDAIKNLTAAKIVELHTNTVQCSNCHSKIDPLGVALEAYDSIGQFRTREVRIRDPEDPNSGTYTAPISTEGSLYNGMKFDGMQEFKQVLMTQRHNLSKAYIKALLSYINGREANFKDAGFVDRIAIKAAENNYLAKEILVNILMSDEMIKH